MPGRPTRRSARRSAGLVSGLFLLLGSGIAVAPSAAAVDDTSRPDYTVTDGPSCHPGGVQIRVVAGTAPYRVVLATTRQPDGEDAADLAPGATVLLRTGDVAHGETIDSRLEFSALDGSGETFADELVPYSFTRPAEEDCAAISPTGAGGSPTAPTTSDGEIAASAGEDLQVHVAAAELPGAPVTRSPDWALIAAGVSLAGTAGGLGLVAVRRRRRDGHLGRGSAVRGTMTG